MTARNIATAVAFCAVMAVAPAATAGAAPAGTELVGSQAGVSARSASGISGPSKKVGTWTARILAGSAVRRRPGGKGVAWYARGRTRWSGTAQRLMVLRTARIKGRMWLRVRLPVRPNGSAGWIPLDRVRLGRTRRYVVIDRSRRTLSIYRRGRRAVSFRVVVGNRRTPTPLGLFAVYDRVRQPDPGGFTGPWVLPLTAHSDVLDRYDGGPGLVALHGRGGSSLLDPLGAALSHGCVRMVNPRIRHLARLMKGTAVRIRQ